MSQEFGWTPEQIDSMTLQELDHYAAQSHKHRANVGPIDVTLEHIRRAFFAFIGVKERPGGDHIEEDIRKMGAVPVAQAEMNAWYEAGMPSPFDGWLHKYRKEHR